MAEKSKKPKHRIDPLDPAFNRPRDNRLRNKMFEDCEFYRMPSEENKKGYKTVCIYRGMFYQVAQNTQGKKKYRVKFSIIFAIIVLIFVCFSLLNYDSNRLWYVGVMEMISLVSLSYVLVTWVIYLTAESKMRSYVYRMTSLKLIRSSGIAAFSLGLCALAIVIGMVVNPGSNLLFNLTGTLGFTVSSAGMIYLRKMEKRLKYKKWLSTEKPPEKK